MSLLASLAPMSSRARLSPLEDRLSAGGVRTHGSLAPGRSRARGLLEIAGDLRAVALDDAHAAVVGPALVRVEEALATSFPENLFLDLDLLAATLARLTTDDAVVRSADLVCKLGSVFGAPPIRFRYAHDFLYGFDWCRWVAKDPSSRGHVGPFDLPFLEYLRSRAEELKGLIDEGDAKYGPIADETYRNPFGFSREPADEGALCVALAERDLLPVLAFDVNGRARWDRPYASLREELAAELGLRRRDTGPT